MVCLGHRLLDTNRVPRIVDPETVARFRDPPWCPGTANDEIDHFAGAEREQVICLYGTSVCGNDAAESANAEPVAPRVGDSGVQPHRRVPASSLSTMKQNHARQRIAVGSVATAKAEGRHRAGKLMARVESVSTTTASRNALKMCRRTEWATSYAANLPALTVRSIPTRLQRRVDAMADGQRGGRWAAENGAGHGGFRGERWVRDLGGLTVELLLARSAT